MDVKLHPLIAELDLDDLVAYLIRRAPEYYCGKYINVLTGIERVQLYQDLETERIEQKYMNLKEIYFRVGRSWNQTMFVVLMKSMADGNNKAQYMELAYRVGYKAMLAERDNIANLESMLIVASGLIGTLPMDEFTDSIRKRGVHLLNKYGISKMHISTWNVRNQLVTKSAVMRFIQISQLIYDNDMLFSKVIACKKRQDILALFDISVRSEWLPYFGTAKSWRISVDKRDLFGINVVIPLLYIFGHHTSDDALTDAAADLNESIPAEKNYYITGWRQSGLNPQYAYDSQALIQLGSEYCLLSTLHNLLRRRGEQVLSRCEECPVFKHLCSPVSAIDRIPIFVKF